ncbi:hypothetical protein T03_158 [Trichinella britovi]|uniref:Uncharacterized protein n=1 Tax=Trichinella britovi TaxID=45882 RepID=A0A0V1CLJ6_TRIBR|nr:hypothetical protein T03_3950 [Trichinella britovi]KRY50127.1 hypothetical protein T03_158 [Trichinella britovi]
MTTMLSKQKPSHNIGNIIVVIPLTVFVPIEKFQTRHVVDDKKRSLNLSTPNRCTEFLAASCIRLRTFGGICKIFTIASEYSSAEDAVKPTLWV